MDADAARLRELGYEQELHRDLRGLDNATLGFATISPVVGLYAVSVVGLVVAGPAWVWVLPVALLGQCLLLVVYSELAAEFPLANGIYQWSRRLLGPSYGWFTGWVVLCAYAVANTTIAYLGAPWALALVGVEPSPAAIVAAGAVIVLACSLINACGVDVLRRAVNAGVAAELVASVGIGVTLLLVFREHGFSLTTEMLGAQAASSSQVAAMLAALAVAGWVFIGFDACVAAAEETKSAARHVPRALWIALLSVGAIVILNAVAVTLAHPDPAAVVRRDDTDPVATTVVSSFGSWSSRPFDVVVLVAFVACGTAAQGMTARGIYSFARDGALPASGSLRRVDRRGVPIGALTVVTVVAWLGLLLGLQSAAIGSMIAFGTAAIYVSFLLVALAALLARVRGSWRPLGGIRLGRAAVVINALAVGWLAFEAVNISWPRPVLAPPGAPWYQIWAAPLALSAIALVGLAYMLVAHPQRHVASADGRTPASA